MTYFVTGATGFIGRHLVERLLEREGDIYVLVREGSTEKLERLLEQCGAVRARSSRCSATSPAAARASTTRPASSSPGSTTSSTSPRSTTSPPTRRTNALLNVGGTQNAVDLANALGAKRFHHMSSIAVAGSYDGWFTEDDFDEGQELPEPVPPHQVRVREARARARSRCRGACTARRSSSATPRPARWTRSTGRTTSSRRSRSSGTRCREWFPLVSLEFGRTNIVPVDYVAAAVDHIAHQDGLDGQAFHIVDPKPPQVRRRAERVRQRGPRPARGDARRQEADRHAPEGRARLRAEDPGAARGSSAASWPTSGSPRRRSKNAEMRTRFDARDTTRALEGTGIELPEARDLRRQAVGLLGAQPRPGPVQGPLVRGARSTARRSSSPARRAASAAPPR